MFTGFLEADICSFKHIHNQYLFSIIFHIFQLEYNHHPGVSLFHFQPVGLDQEKRLDLINTLNEVTEGKIFVEVGDLAVGAFRIFSPPKKVGNQGASQSEFSKLSWYNDGVPFWDGSAHSGNLTTRKRCKSHAFHVWVIRLGWS